MIPLLGIHPKEMQTLTTKRYVHPHVHSTIFLQFPRHGNNLSVHWWMNGLKKLCYIYTIEYYSAIKNEESLLFATWMDFEYTMLSEISQKKTSTVWSPLYVEIFKNLNLKNTKDQTCLYQRQRVGEGKSEGRCSRGTNFQL